MQDTPSTSSERLHVAGVTRRDCPLCGEGSENGEELLYGSRDWPMVECRGCGFVYLGRAPRYEELSANFAWEKTSKAEEHRRLDERPVSKRLSLATRWRMRLLPRRKMPDLVRSMAPPGLVVDVGCGDGGQMDALDDDYTPVGIEISAELALRAHERFAQRGGWCIHAPSVDGLAKIEDASVAAATLRSYLEHELNPLAVSREIKRILRPDGVVLVKVPNYGSWNRHITGRKWCGFRLPDHLNYFTPRTLSEMASRAGLRTQFGPTWRLPTSDNMWAALRHPAGAA